MDKDRHDSDPPGPKHTFGAHSTNNASIGAYIDQDVARLTPAGLRGHLRRNGYPSTAQGQRVIRSTSCFVGDLTRSSPREPVFVQQANEVVRQVTRYRSRYNYNISDHSAINDPFLSQYRCCISTTISMYEWDNGLKLQHSDLWMDSQASRRACFMSHAHTDHIGNHQWSLVTPQTRSFLQVRSGQQHIEELGYEQGYRFDSKTRLTLLPAGHVLGSAMLLAEREEGSLLYTGDFKLRDSLTAPTAKPVRADVLLMESTFGKPLFRFPPWRVVAGELVDRVSTALRDGVQPIVMGYSLGKAQEIVRILTDAGLPVTEHGAVARLSDLYEEHGVALGPRRRYVVEDFVGPQALDLAERGVIVAPPQVARSPFTTRFDKRLTVMMSGWAMFPNSKYRYGVDHVLPLSDHADFDELLRLVEIVQPKRVYTHHGFPEFVDELKKRGINARLAKPSPQLELFD